jgi:hypothetical protein
MHKWTIKLIIFHVDLGSLADEKQGDLRFIFLAGDAQRSFSAWTFVIDISAACDE